MAEQSKSILNKGNNIFIILFVFIQFQVRAVCNLHGFSPQGDVTGNDILGESETKVKRDGESFYNSFVTFKKYNERTAQYSGSDILTREIRIKQGKLKGIVKEFKNKKLNNVETYLGIPYAAPPIKNLRFMPPGSPPTWKETKIFDSFGPVCPQSPPDLTHEPLKTMNAGHYNHLKGLMPFLTNQSEDCLYLNIYAPIQDYKPQKYPVIVYIHGESFEWNSGNPYDGSILASYGSVVVVTINFRLGILGFLKPGLSDHTVSNFGLLDQLAALQWIKDNIGEFGGDPSLVTLMGHGTGAACINFLMVSPVSMASQGLFHKVILMSGTALSDWALTQNPLQFTIQVAEALNCPLIDKDDELANCLRRKRLSEIMSVKITVPEFQTPFGPIIDGSVVPNTPAQVMGVYQNLFTRYEMLYGVVEWETYHSLDPVSLTYGMLEGERNELLRKYMYSRYEALPYFALATTLSEYLDWRKPMPPAKSAAEEHRDLVLDLLSDARYIAPVIQMALYHSKINPKSYLYVFQHKSKLGEFAGSERSVSGEEIAYVFGIPLINEEGPLSHHKFSLTEQLLSESILTYFTNFVKTGNPNAPRRVEYLTQGPKEWQQYDIYWPEYDSKNQSYLALGIPPHISHHYRSQMTQYWNKILPDLLNNPTKLKQQKPELPTEKEKAVLSEKPNHSNPHYKKQVEDPFQWTFGTVRMSPKEYQNSKKLYKPEEENASSKQMDRPPEDVEMELGTQESHTSSIGYFIALTVCLLIVNVIIVGLYCYKKRRISVRDSYRRPSARNLDDDGCDGRMTKADSAYSVIECSGSFVKSEEEKQQKKTPGKLKRCLNNTQEGPTKVKKWIQQEMEKFSKRKNSPPEGIMMTPKQPRKSLTVSEDSSSRATPLKPILKNPNRMYQSTEDLKSISKKNVQKVSVGIDATPSTRGSSVMKQTPIEITKSLDRGLLKDEYEKPEVEEEPKTMMKSRTSVSLQMLPMNDLQYVTSGGGNGGGGEIEDVQKRFQTFFPRNGEDINVTSKDPETVQEDAHVDPLENIQKRNFPKVLPDYPDSKTIKRLSLQQPESFRNKSNPPPPPPRVSTLQRKQKSDESEPVYSTYSSVNFKMAKPKVENEAKTTKKQPSIVIQSKIGPKKPKTKPETAPKKAHINLQETDKAKSVPKQVLDSKGSSDENEKRKVYL